MATIVKQMTPKEKYEALVQNIMDVVFHMPNITDGVMKSVADDCAELWAMKHHIQQLNTLRITVQENTYYQDYVAQPKERKMKSLQEKAQDIHWVNCEKCDRRVRKSNLARHMEADVCKDIRLSKGLTLQHKRIPQPMYPIYHMVNHTICRQINKEYNALVINYFDIAHSFPKQVWRKNGRIPVLVRTGR